VEKKKDNLSRKAFDKADGEGITEIDDDKAEGDGHLRRVGPHEVYTAEEVSKLIAESRTGLERVKHMIACLTEVRHRELNGLQWSRVDFDDAYIFVCRSLTQIGGKAILTTAFSRARRSGRRSASCQCATSAIRSRPSTCSMARA
jgi:integrase